MKCLQDRYDQLESACRAAVRNFTEMTMSDPTLDFLLMKACEPMIQSYCSVSTLLSHGNQIAQCVFLLEYRGWKRR